MLHLIRFLAVGSPAMFSGYYEVCSLCAGSVSHLMLLLVYFDRSLHLYGKLTTQIPKMAGENFTAMAWLVGYIIINLVSPEGR
jgi:hypothetical protein